jgi:hypothetical protein
MSDDDTLCIELLRCHVVRRFCICEGTGLQIVQGHGNREWLIGRDRGEVDGVGELASGHVRLCRDIPHHDRVARARGDLLSVGDRLSHAEVDKVVGAGQGGDLACFLNSLTILFEACFDDTRVKSCGRSSVDYSFCS